eukprot:756119-Hanusia_phi.AAC.1
MGTELALQCADARPKGPRQVCNDGRRTAARRLTIAVGDDRMGEGANHSEQHISVMDGRKRKLLLHRALFE